MQSLAAHVVFGAYGFWLPNDPRGSGTKYVGGENLLPFGKATNLEDRARSVAGQAHDTQLRRAAKEALVRPAVTCTPEQFQSIADGFGIDVGKKRITVWACAIMPDHVHLVIAKHAMEYETLAGQLKNEPTRSLKKAKTHPFSHLKRTAKHHPAGAAVCGRLICTPNKKFWTASDTSKRIHSKRAWPRKSGLLWSSFPRAILRSPADEPVGESAGFWR